MFNKKILPGLILITFTTTVFAQQSTSQTQLLNTCQTYLNKYTNNQVPTGIAQQVSDTSSQCILIGACQTDELSSIDNCAFKLNNLNLYSTTANISAPTAPPASGAPSQQNEQSTWKKPAPEEKPTPIIQSPAATPAQSPESLKNQTPKQNKQQNEQSNKINWF